MFWNGLVNKKDLQKLEFVDYVDLSNIEYKRKGTFVFQLSDFDCKLQLQCDKSFLIAKLKTEHFTSICIDSVESVCGVKFRQVMEISPTQEAIVVGIGKSSNYGDERDLDKKLLFWVDGTKGLSFWSRISNAQDIINRHYVIKN